MKKLLQKGHKDKEEKKKEKKEKEKKEKKEKSKKSKKEDKHSASSSSLEQVPDSPAAEKTTTTVVTKTTISSDSPGSETKTTVVKETVKESHGDRVSETKTEQKVTGDSSGESVVKMTTTTTIIQSEPDQPVETKTILKETNKKIPQGEERVVVKKTTSEVQSVPSTREFLMEKFPEVAKFETRHRVVHDAGSSPSPPTRVSERTVIREVSDGDNKVKTVTKVISDDGGTRETTTTTAYTGENKEEQNVEDKGEEGEEKEDEGDKEIVCEDVERRADLPEWLDNIVDTSTPKEKVHIDDTIQIPSPTLPKKAEKKPTPIGPTVIEEVHPVEDTKGNAMDLLDKLENVGKEKPKEEKPKPPEEIPFNYEPKKPEKKVYKGEPITENVDNLKSVNKAEEGIDFDRLEKKEEPKPTRMVQQTHTRKIISRNNGDTVETVTTTVTDEDGRVKTTETKTISEKDQKPKQTYDVNYNTMESKKNLQADVVKKNEKNVVEDVQDEDGGDDNREILEEIIVTERKRKVRIPKSFVPYEKERPKAVLPFDMLVKRQRSPRKLRPVGRQVNENVEEQNQNRNSEVPDLDELDRLLTAIEAE